MTQTETPTTVVLPNGNEAVTIAHDSWGITLYLTPGASVGKLIAIAPDRRTAIHKEKMSLAAALAFDPTEGRGKSNGGDVMAQLSASIDAAKAAKAVKS